MARRSGPTPVEVQKYLAGVDYPTTRAELVERARDSGAPSEVTSLLEQLPDKEFDSPAAVSKEVA